MSKRRLIIEIEGDGPDMVLTEKTIGAYDLWEWIVELQGHRLKNADAFVGAFLGWFDDRPHGVIET